MPTFRTRPRPRPGVRTGLRTLLYLEALEDRSVPSNAIVTENLLPGNPASEWDISGAGDPSIQGFATNISVNAGQTVYFKIDTPSTHYRLDIYRMGYYGGMGARKVATLDEVLSQPQVQPDPLTDPSTGLVDCGNWSVSASWAVPTNAVSGIYFAKLVREDGVDASSHIVFIVRNDASTSDLLFQTSDATWEAYNTWGGNSLYTGSPAGRAYKVSYNRPFNTRDDGWAPDASWVFTNEYPMVRYLEANGYDVTYFTDMDSDRYGSLIKQHKVFLSVGHDEYWSGGQRANVEAARDAGVNLAFFSGNEVFWKTRWETSIDGSGTPYRTLVCYKETHAGTPIDPLDPPIWTGTWRDPRFSPPADGGRPENALTGTLFMVSGDAPINFGGINVSSDYSDLRFWRNTAVAGLAPGQSITVGSGVLGYEFDEDVDNGFRPAGAFQLSSTTVSVSQYLQDYGTAYAHGTATHHLMMYRAPSGALVFGAGTVQWAWGLDGTHDALSPTTGADINLQQATVNLFADMGVQPETLKSGLVRASASTDRIAPSTTVAVPSSVQAGGTYTISGSAVDTGGGVVAGVEVSTDGGLTWHPAQGRSSWTYTWTAPAPGATTIRARVVDDSGNLGTPTVVNVNVNPADSQPPQITELTTTPTGTGTVVIAWKTDEPSTSRVDYGTSPTALSSFVSNSTLTTTHQITLTGLKPLSPYYYRVTSADGNGNTAVFPAGSNAPLSFSLPLLQTTVADFTGTRSNTSVVQTTDGEVILTPAAGSEFSGTALPSGWTSTAQETGGTATVASGVLTLNGSLVKTNSTYTAGRSLEFRANFSGAADQSAGLAADLVSAPRAVFSTSGTNNGGALYAVTSGTNSPYLIPGNWLGAWHTYRIDWTNSTVTYWIDGAKVLTVNAAISTQMRPAAVSQHVGAGTVAIDWMRMTPYASSGTYTSSVIDAGASITWGTASWNATTPTGTSLVVNVRTGNTATPDGTWTAFTPLSGSGASIGRTSRYLQYRVDLATTDPGQTPAFQDITITKSVAAATATLASSANPASLGQTVTLTVTLQAANSADGTPTGTVTFKDGSTVIGTAALNNGVATFTTAALGVGTHSLTAAYAGDAVFGPVTSAVLSQTVTPASTTTALSSSVNPASSGQPITLTANVTPGTTGTPTGTVTFKDDSTVLGTATLSSGTATFTTSSLTVGTHSLTAAYSGDASFQASTSAPVSQVVNTLGATSTGLASSLNPASPGQSVTLTATVSASGGTPTGSVTFKDGSTVLGTATLSNGVATFKTSSLTPGKHPLTATYGGDTSFNPSISAVLSQMVTVPTSAAFLGTDPSAQGNWKGAYGSDGYNVIGTTANYPAYATVSAGGQQFYIWQDPTTDPRGLQKPGSPTDRIAATWFSSTSFTIDVNLTDGATHRVSLYLLDWEQSGRAERVDVLDASNGTLLDSRPAASFGNGLYLVWNLSGHILFRITATAGSNAVLSGLFFGPAPSTTSLTSSANPASAGQPVTLTASISASAGTPTGTVTFKDGSTVLGTATLSNGTATFTTSALGAGTHALTATYSGDANSQSSTGSLSLTVNTLGATSTALASSLNPASPGQSVTLTATVSASGGTPTGSVTFKDGSTVLGTATLSNGVATFKTSSLALGTHPLTAVYSGDTSFNPSTSAVLNQTVSVTTAAAFLSTDTATQGNWKGAYGSDGYNLIGDTVNYPSYAQVSASGQQSYTWAASTTDRRALQKSGSTTDRIAATWFSPTSFTIDVNLIDGGTHRVSAYLLDWDENGTRSERVDVLDASTGAVLDSRTVSAFNAGEYLSWNLTGHVLLRLTRLGGSNAVLSGLFLDAGPMATTALTSSANPATAGQPLTLTATVSGGGATPTGTVTFKDGSTVLGTVALNNGTATLTTSTLSVGTHSLTATYSGDANYQPSTSAAVSQVVNTLSGTTTTLTSSPDKGVAGKPLTLTASVSGSGGTPTGTVTFKDGSTVIGTATLTNGTASYTIAALTTGTHSFTAVYSGDTSFNPSTSAVLTQNVTVTNAATFLGTDTTTRGSWKGAYGTDGYNVVGTTANYPAYAQVSVSGQQSYTWAASTSDVRGLQKPTSTTDRIAATWFSSTSFTVDLNLIDGATHWVALYLLDWDENGTRSERVDVLDASTGAVLDSRTVSAFNGGEYLSWNLTGHVLIRITRTGGSNAVLSGLFFGT